jgi:hypothetical protein
MKPAAFFALACACLFARPAGAAIGVGVADDTLLADADGGAAFVGVLNDIGFARARVLARPARRPSRLQDGVKQRQLAG